MRATRDSSGPRNRASENLRSRMRASTTRISSSVNSSIRYPGASRRPSETSGGLLVLTNRPSNAPRPKERDQHRHEQQERHDDVERPAPSQGQWRVPGCRGLTIRSGCSGHPQHQPPCKNLQAVPEPAASRDRERHLGGRADPYILGSAPAVSDRGTVCYRAAALVLVALDSQKGIHVWPSSDSSRFSMKLMRSGAKTAVPLTWYRFPPTTMVPA